VTRDLAARGVPSASVEPKPHKSVGFQARTGGARRAASGRRKSFGAARGPVLEGRRPKPAGTLPMDTSDIRKGLKMMLDGQPYTVVDFQFVKPGKGQAFTRVKIRNMATSAVLERTFKSGEKLEPADVEERQLQYIYPEGTDFVFMDAATGEQLTVPGEKIGTDARWLSDGMNVDVTLFNGQPIGVSMPLSVVLQIVTSEPGVKGDTASGATKPATVSTGATVNVPLFVQEGEWIKIDTTDGKYIERVNKR
jgi:elongation factor P